MRQAKHNRDQAHDELCTCAGVQMPTGKVRVPWGGAGTVTPQGQLAYFIDFLHLPGLWAHWCDSGPLHDTGSNAAGKSDVLGASLLSILASRRRYAHVTAMGGDGGNSALLGMGKIISEDALRRAVSAIPDTEGVTRLDVHVLDSA